MNYVCSFSLYACLKVENILGTLSSYLSFFLGGLHIASSCLCKNDNEIWDSNIWKSKAAVTIFMCSSIFWGSF